jgi:purine-binding chemotaxis protein CheW
MSEPNVVRQESTELQAQESEEVTTEQSVREFLAFSLADESYALPLPSVREIVKLPQITEVPRAPWDVLGIISVRGRVTTVVDLRRRLRVEAKPFDRSTRILLVDTGEEIMGLLVDKVLQVFRLREDEIELASVVGSDTAEYVSGIGRPQSGRSMGRYREDSAGAENKGDILILLDPRALLKR